MTDILTAEEIESLIASLTIEGEKQGDTAGHRLPKVRVYDFKRPDKFSKEQIRTLKLVHENMARLMTTALSAHLRCTVQVTLLAIEQMAYEHFSENVSDPAVLGVVRLKPLKGNAMIEVSPEIALPMIDHLLGGSGKAPGVRRALTVIEETVMRRVLLTFLGVMVESWRNIVALEPELDSIESNSLFAKMVAPNEIVVQVSFRVVLGDCKGEINVCLPYLVLEPVLSRLSARYWFAGEVSQENRDLEQDLRRSLSGVLLPIRVELGKARISVSELTELGAGDVILLQSCIGDEVAVFVGDKVKLYGHPGRLRRKLAVRISRVATEGGEQYE